MLTQLVAPGGAAGATSAEVEATTGRPRQRVGEAVLARIRAGAGRVVGEASPPGRSGPAPARDVATTPGRQVLGSGSGGQAGEAAAGEDVAPLAIGGRGGAA